MIYKYNCLVSLSLLKFESKISLFFNARGYVGDDDKDVRTLTCTTAKVIFVRKSLPHKVIKN